ncbi:hypothetical protein ACIQUY_34810 [Streptomyces sp. NPDC090231]|nr:hypothetical protein OG384_36400 [Streptomyces sp. NBC_01324]
MTGSRTAWSHNSRKREIARVLVRHFENRDLMSFADPVPTT